MRIAFLGDIALFGKYNIRNNNHIFDNIDAISTYLSQFDYVVGNLETPFSSGKKTYGAKSAYIYSEAQNVEILKRLHIKAVTLANNHMFDYGVEGYELTKRLLEESGIMWYGTEGKELKIVFQDNKLAFIGYCCYSSNPLKCVKYGEYGVNAYNVQNAVDVLKRNNNDGFFCIMAVHAGIEHVNFPSIEHIRAARLLASTCPYVYYGHHPHVIQGVEEYKGSLLAYSLGNFCFDDIYKDNNTKPFICLTGNNRTGMILELTIESNKVLSWKEQIVYFDKSGKISLIDKSDFITDYNNSVINCENDVSSYMLRRKDIINRRILERKSMRNLKWYLERFHIRYAKLIWDGRKNSKLYEENVKMYLQ